ncbi:glycosyltransferase [Candidatus Fermentibacteria bacterium]|nr:glycosyltransferase [Candidatus Fermentibacteria bacterium]
MAAESSRSLPDLSIVVPAHDAAGTLRRCLEAVCGSGLDDAELIVVDDKSADDSARIAGDLCHRLVRLTSRRGAAAARNAGARAARGAIIVFVDADVVIASDTLHRVREDFSRHPDVAAVQSLYRCPGPVANPWSRYQNDYYHYSLRRVPGDHTSVFATWCAAVRRDVFLRAGGFDERIPGATVEDEEFGYTLVDKGYQILLDRTLLVDHLADYTLGRFLIRRFRMGRSQMKSALRHVRLRLLRRYANVGSNLTHHSRRIVLAIPVSWGIALLLGALLVMPGWRLLAVFLGAWVVLACLGGGFLTHVRVTHGWVAAMVSLGMLWFDMLAVGAGLMVGALEYAVGRRF